MDKFEEKNGFNQSESEQLKNYSPPQVESENAIAQQPSVSQNKEKISIISYFTGAGLLDLGFVNNDFEVVWRNEFNSHFVKGFEYAMSVHTGTEDHKITNKKSILDITPSEVLKEAFKNSIKPETFGIIGGPPCTDFSVGGKNHGEHGKNGKLAGIYVDHILAIQPSFFVLENVKGLFQTGKHKDFLDKLIKRLNVDYITDTKILNALEYGIPQNRERGFLVGFHKDWIKKHKNYTFQDNPSGWFPWTEKKYDNPRKNFNWPGRIPFGSRTRKPQNIPEELMIGTFICNSKSLNKLGNSSDKFVAHSSKFNEIEEGDDTRKSFKRLHRWRYSPTAAYGNNEVHLHPVEPRRLSVREVMMIQSVPDTYALPEDLPLSYKFKMIGNAVPVKLAEAVALSFNTFLSPEFVILRNSEQIQPSLFSVPEICDLPHQQELDSGQI